MNGGEMDVSKASEIKYEAERAVAIAHRRLAAAEAWLGLTSLLKGAWGTENVNALGGGKAQIERAVDVIGADLAEPQPPCQLHEPL
jgi:hypothetical protein